MPPLFDGGDVKQVFPQSSVLQETSKNCIPFLGRQTPDRLVDRLGSFADNACHAQTLASVATKSKLKTVQSDTSIKIAKLTKSSLQGWKAKRQPS